jgi:DNA-binding HxlR family transcriptional regulator
MDASGPAPIIGAMATTPLAAALDRVGDRWSLLLIEALLEGPRRFTELSSQLDGIAPNTLTDRLRRLEAQRVVRSRQYEERPPRVTYELTAEGMELAGALRMLADWGSAVAPEAEPIRHAACGTPVEARWYCATCDRLVEPGDAGDLRFV